MNKQHTQRMASVLLAGVALSFTAHTAADALGAHSTAPTATVATTSTTQYTAPTTSTTVCAEDQPCWDCATMGNKVCAHPAPTYGKLGPYTVTDDITKVPNLNVICWTEYNPYLENTGAKGWNKEGICGDPSKAHSEWFLHWGLETAKPLQSTDDY